MTHTETNKQGVESSELNTPDALLELKKKVAEEIVNKLQEKDPDILSKVFTNYLVNDGTILDKLSDNILGGLGEIIGIISPDLKRYREMLNTANTKQEIENLKSNILSEIGTTQTSADSKENSPTTSNSTQNESTNTNKKDSEKKEKVKEGVDKEKKTYTNPKSGLTYKCIDQVLDPAGSLKYSGKRKGKTVADIGCLLASGCTITSALSPSVTLKDCFYNVRHWTADKAVPKMSDNKRKSEALLSGEHGNRTKAQEQQAQAKIEENLEKGYPAIIGARHKGIDGINSSISSQHYRAIVDMRTNNGKKEFFVANTYRNGTGGWLSEDKIFKNMIHASIFKPNSA